MSIAVHGAEILSWINQLRPCDKTETFGGALDSMCVWVFLFVRLYPDLIALTLLQAPTLPVICTAVEIKKKDHGGRRR